jgi:hypothetical protein
MGAAYFFHFLCDGRMRSNAHAAEADNPAMHLLRSIGLPACLGLALAWNQAAGGAVQRLEETTFGKMPDGAPVQLFILRNAKGMTAKVMTYGAVLTELRVPDRHGATTNVVQGAETFEVYRNGFPAPAAIIGRVANRIANALVYPWVQGWKMHSFNQYPFVYLDIDTNKQKAALK